MKVLKNKKTGEYVMLHQDYFGRYDSVLHDDCPTLFDDYLNLGDIVNSSHDWCRDNIRHNYELVSVKLVEI